MSDEKIQEDAFDQDEFNTPYKPRSKSKNQIRKFHSYDDDHFNQYSKPSKRSIRQARKNSHKSTSRNGKKAKSDNHDYDEPY